MTSWLVFGGYSKFPSLFSESLTVFFSVRASDKTMVVLLMELVSGSQCGEGNRVGKLQGLFSFLEGEMFLSNWWLNQPT